MPPEPQGRQRKITEQQLRDALTAGRTPAQIADQYGMSAYGVRKRIAELEDADTAAACKPENNARAVQGTIDAMTVLLRLLHRAERLHDACDRYLQDPDHPDRYDVGPRAGEIEVVYWKKDERGQRIGRRPERKDLQSLLDVALDADCTEFVAAESKHADPRTLLISASAEQRAIIDSAKELAQLLVHGQRMERFMASVQEKFARLAPEVAREIAEELRRDLLVNPAFRGPDALPFGS